MIMRRGKACAGEQAWRAIQQAARGARAKADRAWDSLDKLRDWAHVEARMGKVYRLEREARIVAGGAQALNVWRRFGLAEVR